MKNVMKKSIAVLLALTLTVGLAPMTAVKAEKKTAGEKTSAKEVLKKEQRAAYAKGEVLVQLKSADVSLKASSAFGEPVEGIKIKDRFTFKDVVKSTSDVKASSASKDDLVIMAVSSETYSTEQLIKMFQSRSNVKYAEPNYLCYPTALTNDTYSSYQWSLKNTGQDKGAEGEDINVKAAWDGSGVNGTDQSAKNAGVVAVLDSGVDYTHEDLKDNMWKNPYPKNLPGTYGYNFYDDNKNPMDEDGHGTHVAGIIGAKGNNGTGISGIDQSAQIMALKFMGEYGGDLEDALEAYQYVNQAQQMGINVVAINNSWGGEGTSRIFESAMNKVGKNGALSICAAGNANGNEDENPTFPGTTDSPYVINVAALSSTGELATYSNYGKEQVDIAAPGSNILSSVSVPTFNPTLYDNKADYCQQFSDFEGNESFSGIDGGEPYLTSAGTTSVDNKEYFGLNSDGKSLKWEIKGAKSGKEYVLYLPYEAKASEGAAYVSAAAKITKAPKNVSDLYWGCILFSGEGALDEDGTFGVESEEAMIAGIATDTNENGWNHLTGQVSEKVSEDGEKRAVVFRLFVEKSGDYQINIDNVAVSKENIDPETLGKYDFYSGTSMAAPMVTGAVSLLNSIKGPKTRSAKAMKDALLSMVRTSGALSDKVATGGTLDLSAYQRDLPSLEKAAVDGSQKIVLTGSFFGQDKGTVKANGQEIAADKMTWEDKKITIAGTDLVNQKVTFEVTDALQIGTAKETFYLVNGKKTFTEVSDAEEVFDGYGSMVTDGKDLYNVNLNGDVDIYLEEEPEDWDYPEDEKKYLPGDGDDEDMEDSDFYPVGEISEAKDIFPKATEEQLNNGRVVIASEAVYLNGRIYCVMELYSRTFHDYALASFDLNKEKWTKYADMPNGDAFKNVTNSTLAVYNNQLYLLGGIDLVTGQVSTAVCYLDASAKAWKNTTPLPEGRFSAKGLQQEDALILILGGNNEQTIPAPLVLKNGKWTVGPALTALNDTAFDSVEVEDKEKPGKSKEMKYYRAALGIVAGGVIISGFPCQGLGDTFIYNISTNKYQSTAYQLSTQLAGYVSDGISVGPDLYVMKGVFSDDAEEDEGYFESAELLSMPVNSGLSVIVASPALKNGKIEGVGSHLPGQTVTLLCTAKKGYYIKSFSVNGKVVKSKSNVPVSKSVLTGKKVTVSASFTKYKTKVKLNKTKATLKAGKTLKLKAKVTGAFNSNKKVTWKSSNKKYATVDKKGKVKVKKAGKGKSVTITATAADGSGKKAKCVIKIKK